MNLSRGMTSNILPIFGSKSENDSKTIKIDKQTPKDFKSLQFILESELDDPNNESKTMITIDFGLWTLQDLESFQLMFQNNKQEFDEMMSQNNHESHKKDYELLMESIKLNLESINKTIENEKLIHKDLWESWIKTFEHLNGYDDTKYKKILEFIFIIIIIPYCLFEEVSRTNIIHIGWKCNFFGPLFSLWYIQKEFPLETFFENDRIETLVHHSKDLSSLSKQFFGIIVALMITNSCLVPFQN